MDSRDQYSCSGELSTINGQHLYPCQNCDETRKKGRVPGEYALISRDKVHICREYMVVSAQSLHSMRAQTKPKPQTSEDWREPYYDTHIFLDLSELRKDPCDLLTIYRPYIACHLGMSHGIFAVDCFVKQGRHFNILIPQADAPHELQESAEFHASYHIQYIADHCRQCLPAMFVSVLLDKKSVFFGFLLYQRLELKNFLL